MKPKQVEFVYMITIQNLTDMFTKNLFMNKFEFNKEEMGVHSITPSNLELMHDRLGWRKRYHLNS
jgi:hypothetical protein